MRYIVHILYAVRKASTLTDGQYFPHISCGSASRLRQEAIKLRLSWIQLGCWCFAVDIFFVAPILRSSTYTYIHTYDVITMIGRQ